MVKVVPLKRGSTLAVVSPSWGGPSVFPQVYELGVRRLTQEFGFRIKEYPTTRGLAEHNRLHPEERARDLTTAFHDFELSDDTQNPTTETLRSITKALDVSIDKLIK